MKKIFPILSAFIFLFGGAGYYIAFTVMDCGVKNEITQSINFSSAHQIVKLYFSKKELLNEVRFTSREQNEFLYKGENYDVVNINKDGDRIELICIADKKETALFGHFNNKVNEQSSANASGKTTVKFVTQDWFLQTQTPEAPARTSGILSSSRIFFLPNVLFRIPSPPPKSDKSEVEFFVA